jgi:hypothetical protein
MLLLQIVIGAAAEAVVVHVVRVHGGRFRAVRANAKEGMTAWRRWVMMGRRTHRIRMITNSAIADGADRSMGGPR